MPSPPDLRAFLKAFARIALYSFGGPAGQIAVMHRILVEELQWLSEDRFLRAMHFCMLLPGPEAQQLATYSGWLLRGWRGGLLAGSLFILPGFVSILALGFAYAYWHDFAVLHAVFYGLKAAVVAIVIQALLRIGKRALQTTFKQLLAATAFFAIFFLNVPFPMIVLAAALIGIVFARVNASESPGASDAQIESAQPVRLTRTLRTVAIWLGIWALPPLVLAIVHGTQHVLFQQSIFFSKAATVTFGGAYSVLAYIAQAAVEQFGWLLPGEMLDGLGLAETTPGPLIMVVEFVGFLGAFRNPAPYPAWLAGILGASVTVWVTFAPCFLWIFAGAPYIESINQNPRMQAALEAITAAVAGVILNLSVWFAMHCAFSETIAIEWFAFAFDWPIWSSFDPIFFALMLLAGGLIFWWRASMLVTLAITMLAGLAVLGARSYLF